MSVLNEFYDDYFNLVNLMNKISIFTETSFREYRINLKETALKIVEEDGSKQDYEILVEETKTNFIDTIKATIKKIVDSIKEFVTNCKNKIVSIFTSKQMSDTVDDINKAIKNDPSVKNIKIKYKETNKSEKELDKGIHNIAAVVAKVKARGGDEDDIEKVEKAKEESIKRAATYVSTGIITVSAALMIISKYKKSSKVEDEFSGSTDGVDEIGKKSDNIDNAMDARVISVCANNTGKLSREKASMKYVKATSIRDALQRVVNKYIKHETEVDTSDFDSQESAIDSLPIIRANNMLKKIEIYDNITERTDENTLGIVEGLDLDEYYKSIVESVSDDI